MMDTSLPENTKKSEKKYLYIAGAGALIIFFVAINMYMYVVGRKNQGQSALSTVLSPFVSPTPTPFPINRHGKMTFTVMSETNGPRVTQGFVDPYDVKPGGSQDLNIYISNTIPVDSVTGIWKTDTKEKTVSFMRVSGTEKEGWWGGSWIADDTLFYRLNIDVTVTDANGSYMQTLTLR